MLENNPKRYNTGSTDKIRGINKEEISQKLIINFESNISIIDAVAIKTIANMKGEQNK